jgi:hypothetical protein
MPSTDRSVRQERIIAYLLERVDDDRPFVKSRYIASDLDISAKRAGHILSQIEREDPRIDLERRGGNSNGTTWRITAGRAFEP